MTALDPEHDTNFTRRQRDRRMAMPGLLAALMRSLDGRSDVGTLRLVFEEALRRIVPVRSVQLRDGSARAVGRSEGIGGAESIVFDVPGVDHFSQGVLEATFDPACRLGEWDFQQLGVAVHIGALVLEIERSRRPPRNGAIAARVKRDGAAPLIGSTRAMETLRSSIERVAGTDFTVLLEGPSDPQ